MDKIDDNLLNHPVARQLVQELKQQGYTSQLARALKKFVQSLMGSQRYYANMDFLTPAKDRLNNDCLYARALLPSYS